MTTGNRTISPHWSSRSPRSASSAGSSPAAPPILRDGREITLKVEPVDPRDLLRGDYVAWATRYRAFR